MTKKMLNKLVNLYDDIYSDVPYHKVKMVSFIIYKGKILCWGVNSDKTSTLQHYWRIRTRDTHEYIYDKRHSEIDCINKIPRDFTDFHKAELVIISKKADGNGPVKGSGFPPVGGFVPTAVSSTLASFFSQTFVFALLTVLHERWLKKRSTITPAISP